MTRAGTRTAASARRRARSAATRRRAPETTASWERGRRYEAACGGGEEPASSPESAVGGRLGGLGALPEPVGEERRQGLPGGVGVEVGKGVDVQAVPAVRGRDDDGAVDLRGAGADREPPAHQAGAETEPLSGVVIAGSENHASGADQTAQGVVEEED